jgi:hypothetical protein
MYMCLIIVSEAVLSLGFTPKQGDQKLTRRWQRPSSMPQRRREAQIIRYKNMIWHDSQHALYCSSEAQGLIFLNILSSYKYSL